MGFQLDFVLYICHACTYTLLKHLCVWNNNVRQRQLSFKDNLYVIKDYMTSFFLFCLVPLLQ